MPDRFDAALEALERGDVDLAAELELSQRPRRSDWQGRREFMATRLDEELAELVKDLAGRTGQTYSATLSYIVYKFFFPDDRR